jgi:hypothetical protein
MLTVTLDTNAVDDQTKRRLQAACAGRAVQIAHTTVTDRELEPSDIAASAGELKETAVWTESRWDQSVWGDEDQCARFEEILSITSNGSFPSAGMRSSLSDGEKKQLRDAMILETHTRERRTIFVSDDERAFIRGGRREKLQALCSTRIMTTEEFLHFAARPGRTGLPASG